MVASMLAQAFVLHLPRARGRQENARRLAAGCGLPAEIWPAVDGGALAPEDIASETGVCLFEPPYPFALRAGEIGCFLSHRQIWAEIIRRDLDVALVLEDDISLDPAAFPHALTLALRHVETFGYVQLQSRPVQGAARLIDTEGTAKLVLPVIPPLRTSAQLVSRDGARRLLATAQRFDRPVDTHVQSHWHTGLRPAVIHPSGVATISDQLDGSTIQTGTKTLRERIWREGARLVYRRRAARLARQSSAPIPDAATGPETEEAT